MTKKEVQKKPERTAEETAKLKRDFQLQLNSYHAGEVKDADISKLNNWIFQGDGDYLIHDNRIARFVVKMSDAKRPGLPIEFNGHQLMLHVPKIPKEIYHLIYMFFKDIADDMNDAEAFVQIYYDLDDKVYEIHVPKQTVSKASVSYDKDQDLDKVNRERYIFVAEIHSHNTMPAYFSGTDDKDEKEPRFFGVMGNIKNPIIEEKYRFIVMGKEVLINRTHIFDFTDATVSYPKNWRTNIKKYISQPTILRKDIKKSISPSWKDIQDEDLDYLHNCDIDPETGEIIDYDMENADIDFEKRFGDHDYESDIKTDVIYENFDLDEIEDEERTLAIQTFISSINRDEVTLVLEELTDQGFDYDIKQYQG